MHYQYITNQLKKRKRSSNRHFTVRKLFVEWLAIPPFINVYKTDTKKSNTTILWNTR